MILIGNGEEGKLIMAWVTRKDGRRVNTDWFGDREYHYDKKEPYNGSYVYDKAGPNDVEEFVSDTELLEYLDQKEQEQQKIRNQVTQQGISAVMEERESWTAKQIRERKERKAEKERQIEETYQRRQKDIEDLRQKWGLKKKK